MTRGKFLGSKAIFCLWPGLRGFAKKPHKTITSCLSGASLEKIGVRFRHANFFSDREGDPLVQGHAIFFRQRSVRYGQLGVDLHDWRVCSVLLLWYGLGGKLSNSTFREKEAVG